MSTEQAELREVTRGDFEAGLEAYYAKQFDDAVGSFAKVMRANPEDRAAILYRSRSAAFIGTPPDEAWEGVEKVLTK